MVFFEKYYKNLFPTFIEDVQLIDLNKNERRNFSRTHSSLPMANVIETDELFKIEMAIPGIKFEFIHIRCSNNKLTVSSDLEVDTDESNLSYSRREFSYQSFSRSFNLPKGTIDESNLIINYNNGVLNIKLPKCNKQQLIGMKGTNVA